MVQMKVAESRLSIDKSHALYIPHGSDESCEEEG